jgi:phospholipid/cholesterol/gamma-HCH transport system permease protein
MNIHSPKSKFVEIKREQGKTSLVLEGEWTVQNAGPIEAEVDDVLRRLGKKPYDIVTKKIERLDTSGAFLLKRLLPEGGMPAHLSKTQKSLLEFLPPFEAYKPKAKQKLSRIVAFFSTIGEKSYVARDFLWEIFGFIGRVSLSLLRNFLHPRHFRLTSIVRHIDETGILALPIVGLLAVMISMVITYQGAVQLKKFGADIYTVDLTVISLLREMGVLVTAIMVAGRSGSAFAAEIGVMKLREEVNALTTMGMDPIEVLVVPRVIALVVTLPLLTFLADIIGLVGGGLMSLSLLNISFHQYFLRVQEVATPTMFFIGMIKAPVFAFVIAIIGCYQGFNVSGSAESIGRRTTLAVVQAIFIVMGADAIFSVIFSKAGV